ncbi:MAG: hypothetical protein AB1391_04430 [Candidatus Micrarchaeota archaeon]
MVGGPQYQVFEKNVEELSKQPSRQKPLEEMIAQNVNEIIASIKDEYKCTFNNEPKVKTELTTLFIALSDKKIKPEAAAQKIANIVESGNPVDGNGKPVVIFDNRAAEDLQNGTNMALMNPFLWLLGLFKKPENLVENPYTYLKLNWVNVYELECFLSDIEREYGVAFSGPAKEQIAKEFDNIVERIRRPSDIASDIIRMERNVYSALATVISNANVFIPQEPALMQGEAGKLVLNQPKPELEKLVDGTLRIGAKGQSRITDMIMARIEHPPANISPLFFDERGGESYWRTLSRCMRRHPWWTRFGFVVATWYTWTNRDGIARWIGDIYQGTGENWNATYRSFMGYSFSRYDDWENALQKRCKDIYSSKISSLIYDQKRILFDCWSEIEDAAGINTQSMSRYNYMTRQPKNYWKSINAYFDKHGTLGIVAFDELYRELMSYPSIFKKGKEKEVDTSYRKPFLDATEEFTKAYNGYSQRFKRNSFAWVQFTQITDAYRKNNPNFEKLLGNIKWRLEQIANMKPKDLTKRYTISKRSKLLLQQKPWISVRSMRPTTIIPTKIDEQIEQKEIIAEKIIRERLGADKKIAGKYRGITPDEMGKKSHNSFFEQIDSKKYDAAKKTFVNAVVNSELLALDRKRALLKGIISDKKINELVPLPTPGTGSTTSRNPYDH